MSGWSEPSDGWPAPEDWGNNPTPLEMSQPLQPKWSEEGPLCLCGECLGAHGDHADGTPRCTALEHRAGIIIGNVGEVTAQVERGLDKLQALVGEPEPKPKRGWFGGGGSGQVRKPPPFRRFGIGNR